MKIVSNAGPELVTTTVSVESYPDQRLSNAEGKVDAVLVSIIFVLTISSAIFKPLLECARTNSIGVRNPP